MGEGWHYLWREKQVLDLEGVLSFCHSFLIGGGVIAGFFSECFVGFIDGVGKRILLVIVGCVEFVSNNLLF